jgi:hypothetical protein
MLSLLSTRVVGIQLADRQVGAQVEVAGNRLIQYLKLEELRLLKTGLPVTVFLSTRSIEIYLQYCTDVMQ